MSAAEMPDVMFDCWCGAKGVLVDYSELADGCGGTGYRHCFCGGDQCVCHFHGGEECDGCEDCGIDGDGEYF